MRFCERATHRAASLPLKTPIENRIAWRRSVRRSIPSIGYDWASGLKALLRQDPRGDVWSARSAMLQTASVCIRSRHDRPACRPQPCTRAVLPTRFADFSTCRFHRINCSAVLKLARLPNACSKQLANARRQQWGTEENSEVLPHLQRHRFTLDDSC